MKPILIHCHIYHVQFWEELKKCIQNVEQYPIDLYVTMVENHEDIQKDIVKNFPHAKVQIVEGRGFDVGPFIHVLNQVNLDDYSYIIKLHTKRDLPKDDLRFRRMHSDIWRNNLLLPFRDRGILHQYIENLEKCPMVGMSACYKLFIKSNSDKVFDKISRKVFKSFLHKKKLKNISFQYVGGTMFIVRASLFKYIQNMGLSLQDFSFSNRNEKGDLAHIFERFFGYVVYIQGHTIRDVIVSEKTEKAFQRREKIKLILYQLFRFFFQKKVTKSGKLIIKICEIPVYRGSV